MTVIELLDLAMAQINGLILQGLPNWQKAQRAMDILDAVKKGIQEEDKRREEAQAAILEAERKRREADKARAAENGGEIIGGQTIKIDLGTGEQTTLIE